MIISISGKIGVGKDCVAGIIQSLTSSGDNLTASELLHIFEKTGLTVIRLHDKSPFVIKKFASKLKQIVCLLTGCTMDDLEDQEFKSTPLENEWRIGGYEKEHIPTYRWLLQIIGTEAMRNTVHPDIWVNALFSDYKPEIYQSEPPVRSSAEVLPKWIISDTRFPNELKAVKDRGGITIRVNRNIREAALSTHPSETALDNAEFDYVIDNSGSMEDLILKVENILKTEKII